MRVMAAMALGLLVLAGPVGAQSDQEAADIRAVIDRQFAAFRIDDFETAFSFASPTIRRLFGTPERFGQMVRNGYPMVHRPGSVDYTNLQARAGRFYQSVVITDGKGALHILEYEMIPQGDGWRINGVEIKRPGALGA